MENLEMVYALFNQYLYQDAKNNIDLIDYHFNTTPGTMGNKLIEELLGSIRKYPLEVIDLPLFQSILMRSGKTIPEQKKIMDDIIRWKGYGKDSIAPAKQFLTDLCSSSLIKMANSKFSGSPSDFIKFLKSSNIKSDISDAMYISDFDKLDINSMVAEGYGRGFQSRYPWINDLFGPLGAIPSGNIVMVSAPPGTGKTLYMMQEALTMALAGHRVHYLAMGDMKPRDFIVRMGAIFSGSSFSQTTMELGPIYNSLKGAISDRFGMTIVPSAMISVDEYMEFVKDKDYDVLFIDYDSNFKSEASENMYLEYGKIYDKLSELSIGRDKLVFIACQPKMSSWSDEVIFMESMGESSRKVHCVDVILSFGKAKSGVSCGICRVAKNRRGEENVEIPYVRLNNGRFKFIPKGLYNNLKGTQEKRVFTEGELDRLISQYNVQTHSPLTQQFNNGSTMAAPVVKGRPVNPFNS